MAYDAGVAAGLSPDILAMYECHVMKYDPAWYVENAGLNISKQEELEADALDALLPQVESLIKGLGVEQYVAAPIASDESWQEFVEGLELFDGEGKVDLSGQANHLSVAARL